tara:strand:+ start:400 stop:735 length:336 start_codon:yes stop_codon:yes gene_type:complete
MGRASREKGKRGEREFAGLLRQFGIESRRTQQYCGKAGTSDVSSSLEGVHIEVKRYARIAAMRFMDQAKADCKPDHLPLVAMREDGGQWAIMFRAEDLHKIATRIVDAVEM